MNDDSMQNLGQVSPEEAMRQLVDLRLQVGGGQFRSLASQMGMPGELLDYIEQVATQVETNGAAGAPTAPPAAAPSSARPSGLVDASGRPIGGGAGLGLVDASGRPLGGGGFSAAPVEDTEEEEIDEELEGDDDEDVITLSEDESRQLFQELVGVRMIVGPENFVSLAEQMGMPQDASEMVENAALQIEDEIATRYENQDEAMTVRLVNARMMMGQERFIDLAQQVGMPQEVVDDVEQLASEIEANSSTDDDEDEDEDLRLND